MQLDGDSSEASMKTLRHAFQVIRAEVNIRPGIWSQFCSSSFPLFYWTGESAPGRYIKPSMEVRECLQQRFTYFYVFYGLNPSSHWDALTVAEARKSDRAYPPKISAREVFTAKSFMMASPSKLHNVADGAQSGLDDTLATASAAADASLFLVKRQSELLAHSTHDQPPRVINSGNNDAEDTSSTILAHRTLRRRSLSHSHIAIPAKAHLVRSKSYKVTNIETNSSRNGSIRLKTAQVRGKSQRRMDVPRRSWILKRNSRAEQEAQERAAQDATYYMLVQHFQLRKVADQDGVEPVESLQVPISRNRVQAEAPVALTGSTVNQRSGEDTNSFVASAHCELETKDGVSRRGKGTVNPYRDTNTLSTDRLRLTDQANRSTYSSSQRSNHDNFLSPSLTNFLKNWRSKRVRRRLKRALRDVLVPFSPDGIVSRIRVCVLTCVLLFQLVYVPLLPAYLHSSGVNSTRSINITIELLYLFDLLIVLNTSYRNPETGKTVYSRGMIFRHYLANWMIIDCLASIPIELIQASASRDLSFASLIMHTAFQIPRFVSLFTLFSRMWGIFRAMRVGKSLYAWLQYSRYAHLMRIVRMILLVLLTAHYVGCGWRLVSNKYTSGESTRMTNADLVAEYVADMYYAMLLIQGQGDPNSATVEQNAFSIMAVLLGSLMLALVFANVTVLVSNFYANSTNYQHKMEIVHETMAKMRLPQELRDRVQHYYAHLWQQYDSLDGNIDQLVKELTPTLALEVGLFKYMNLITQVPLWAACSPDFVAHIVRSLVIQVYMPDDYVIRRGEIRRELFMIHRGVCERTDISILFDRPEHPTTISDPEFAPKLINRGGNPNKRSSVARERNNRGVISSCLDTHMKKCAILNAFYPSSTSRTTSDSSSCRNDTLQDSEHELSSQFAVSPERNRQRVELGQPISAMALLANYKQPANVRAATYVEMCILQRQAFQHLLVLFPEDRRRVLRTMLRDAVEQRELPLSWKQVCDRVAYARSGISRADLIPAEITTDEIVTVLLDDMDHEELDMSIVFGLDGLSDTAKHNSSSLGGGDTLATESGETSDDEALNPDIPEHDEPVAQPEVVEQLLSRVGSRRLSRQSTAQSRRPSRRLSHGAGTVLSSTSARLDGVVAQLERQHQNLTPRQRDRLVLVVCQHLLDGGPAVSVDRSFRRVRSASVLPAAVSPADQRQQVVVPVRQQSGSFSRSRLQRSQSAASSTAVDSHDPLAPLALLRAAGKAKHLPVPRMTLVDQLWSSSRTPGARNKVSDGERGGTSSSR